MTDQILESSSTDSSSLAGKSEEDLYALALCEMSSEFCRPGLWAKALSESLGDEKKAEALYLRYRKDQLQEEQARELQITEETRRATEEARRAKVVVFKCPSCSTERKKVTQGIIDDLLSNNFPDWVFKCGDCKHCFDLRDALPELREASPPKSHPVHVQSPAQSETQKKGLAIASLILGIIGGWASTASIPAVICGHLSLSRIKKYPKLYGGKGMAIAGLILGYIGLVLAIALGTVKGLSRVLIEQMGY
ncbi:MAG: DUF4190 domain-containing protein [Kiritimatiellae bacterium]|nr:DUF4190 domain-containing protein [Kiritimatiellia bacterium]